MRIIFFDRDALQILLRMKIAVLTLIRYLTSYSNMVCASIVWPRTRFHVTEIN